MTTRNDVPHPVLVAVIGCGRMGRLHARAYSQTPSVKLIGVFDSNPEAAAAAAREYGTTASTIEQLLDRAQAVSIAVPTEFHLSTAEPFLRKGIACLIEKPLARNTDEARRIVDLGRDHNAIVQVGHIERFNPVVRAMQGLNIRPKYIEVTRISPMTFRSLDVGVVLDMMIHDIDIVLRLADSPVKAVQAVGVGVLCDEYEDICNARLEFENGCIATLTASRLALRTERRLRAFASDAYVSIDYQKKEGIIARRGENLAAIRDVVARIRKGEITDPSKLDYAGLVKIEQLKIDDVEPIRAQLDSFIGAVTKRSAPEVPAEQGLAAVETAERITRAISRELRL